MLGTLQDIKNGIERILAYNDIDFDNPIYTEIINLLNKTKKELKDKMVKDIGEIIKQMEEQGFENIHS